MKKNTETKFFKDRVEEHDNKNMRIETYDRHGNFLSSEKKNPEKKYEEEFDRHGNFLGTKEIKPPKKYEEEFDRHGNFLGYKEIKSEDDNDNCLVM